MQLKFERNVPADWERFLAKVFHLLNDRLGIKDYNKEVVIKLLPDEGQEEMASITPSKLLDKSGCPSKFLIKLYINDKNGSDRLESFLKVIVSFAHEMVHLRQWLRGELKVGPNTELMYWGVKFDRNKLKYEDLPEEKEPHKLMYPLAEWVLETLAKEVKRKEVI